MYIGILLCACLLIAGCIFASSAAHGHLLYLLLWITPNSLCSWYAVQHPEAQQCAIASSVDVQSGRQASVHACDALISISSEASIEGQHSRQANDARGECKTSI